VFDLDSTLITEEDQVQIRDSQIYNSLFELKELGCVLVLWSYGSRDHVAHSLKKVQLDSYFDLIISEGSSLVNNSDVNKKSISKDGKLNIYFYENKFKYDLDVPNDNNWIPKTPKIVIKYLSDKNINCFKSITLVDDLSTNNYAYDYFIKVTRCPVPKHDWHHYHSKIVQNFL
jgi:viral phosphatase